MEKENKKRIRGRSYLNTREGRVGLLHAREGRRVVRLCPVERAGGGEGRMRLAREVGSEVRSLVGASGPIRQRGMRRKDLG
ncbi:hypothetical protein KFK09_016450 [Dendrobium nobile]|uniref:Uncharacterized protein n=1 Tax=Dendrobium nobile TaxID=94219 RepID=A0A8T3B4S5_DENNO|nr:hypothetical protein KFK09_016450 [Dendrobium nobile]